MTARPSGVSAATLEAMVEAAREEFYRDLPPRSHHQRLMQEAMEAVVRVVIDAALASGELVPRREQEPSDDALEAAYDAYDQAIPVGEPFSWEALKKAVRVAYAYDARAALSGPPKEEESER